jgi:hypothetical protein
MQNNNEQISEFSNLVFDRFCIFDQKHNGTELKRLIEECIDLHKHKCLNSDIFDVYRLDEDILAKLAYLIWLETDKDLDVFYYIFCKAQVNFHAIMMNYNHKEGKVDFCDALKTEFTQYYLGTIQETFDEYYEGYLLERQFNYWAINDYNAEDY